MMESITWGEFLKGLGILLLLYYSYVFIRYYRISFADFLKKLKSPVSLDRPADFEPTENLIGRVSLELTEDSESEAEVLKKLRNKLLRGEIPESKDVRGLLAKQILIAAQSKGIVISEVDLLDLLGIFSK